MKVLRFDEVTEKDGPAVKVRTIRGFGRSVHGMCACVDPPVQVHLNTGGAQVRAAVLGVAHTLYWYMVHGDHAHPQQE